MKEQLSALIDGELDLASAEHVIKSAKSGGELKNAWAHYHLIGDALRGEIGRGELHIQDNVATRIMSALEQEPIIFAPNANTYHEQSSTDLQANIGTPSRAAFMNRAFKNTKLWSMAASVAAVMFVGVMVLQMNQAEDLAPVEIAQSVPTEYLQAHQAAAPNGAAYYIQSASYSESKQ
jgi:sigma-E factor negative regulatory protein RseA